MKTFAPIAVLAAIALIAHPAPAFAQAPLGYIVRPDATPCLRVRTSPTSTAAVTACLPPGTHVEATGVAAYWREIRFGTTGTGWAAKRYLAFADSAAAGGAPAVEPANAWLEVHVVDVGQGDGIWIHTFDDNVPGNHRYEGRNIIIDGGPDGDDTKNTLLSYMLQRAHEGARIDALVITHPHKDHYPGAAGILRHFEVSDFYDSGYPKSGDQWADFLALVGQETAAGHPIVRHIGRASFGTLDWGDELKVEVLYAWPGAPAGLGSGNTVENNASIVIRIEYGTQSILLVGDIEGKTRDGDPAVARYAERLLLDADSAGLHSTVLKVAHHGSETSSTLPFIAAVSPRYVIVSSGRQKFGPSRFLPDTSALRRYCTHDPATRIYRTDEGDEAEHRTTTNDADGDNIVIRMTSSTTVVEAYSSGVQIQHTSCAP